MSNDLIVPVILCGGSGTRLWPASRENHPKQFLSLMNDFSLLQNTMRRTLRACNANASALVTVTLGNMKRAVMDQLAEIDASATGHILCEPSARNTAAAVAFAADYVHKTFGENAILWILPADHHIANEDVLAQSFKDALRAAKTGQLVTFGINPTRPDTGYGYIRVGAANDCGKIHAVEQFVEKPDYQTAVDYLESGDYLWNSGMFLFSAKSVIDHYESLAPKILADVRGAMESSMTQPCAKRYAGIESQPFDKAIMEKSARVSVVPCNPEWSDIGSWESLWDIRDKDANNNVIEGKAACFNAQGCLIQSKDRLIAIAGLDNIVVVETEDALLITNKSDNDSMKTLVKNMKIAGAPEVVDMPSRQPAQPWTMIKSLPGETALNASEIVLKPGQQKTFLAQDAGLCLYTVLDGVATISFDDTIKTLKAFESTDIQTAGDYKIMNRGTADLKMIEVQKDRKEGIFFGTPSVSNDIKKTA